MHLPTLSCQGLLIQIALSLSIKIDRVYISELQNGIIYIYILSNIFRRISSTLSQAIYEEKFWAIKCGFQTLLSAPSARTLTPILSASKIACSMRLLILSFPKGRKYWTQKPHQKARKRDAIVKNQNHALKNISFWTADNNLLAVKFLNSSSQTYNVTKWRNFKHTQLLFCCVLKLSTKDLSSW